MTFESIIIARCFLLDTKNRRSVYLMSIGLYNIIIVIVFFLLLLYHNLFDVRFYIDLDLLS